MGNIKIKKSNPHLGKKNGDNISRVMKDSQDDTPRSNSPSILTNSLKCNNEKSDDSSDSESSQILLTKKSNKRKTVFDSDTNSESLTDGNEDNYSSSRSIKEQSNVEKENQLRRRLLKKLKRKKRSSEKIKVSPTKFINTSLETKNYASNEKSPVLDCDYEDGEQNDRESDNPANESMNTSSSSIARISDLRDRLNQKKKYKTKHVNKSKSDTVLSDNDNESSIHNERVVITSIVSNDKDTSKQSNRIVTLHKSNNE